MYKRQFSTQNVCCTQDYKAKVRTLMVATSVAGRGLDVKDLVLVVNYNCPNHLEDYVHRVTSVFHVLAHFVKSCFFFVCFFLFDRLVVQGVQVTREQHIHSFLKGKINMHRIL